jgi:hypothetical protein
MADLWIPRTSRCLEVKARSLAKERQKEPPRSREGNKEKTKKVQKMK